MSEEVKDKPQAPERPESEVRFVPLDLTDPEREILTAPVRDDEIAIRPDNGALYMPEVHIRKRLNDAFGPGQWTLWKNCPAQFRTDLQEVVYDATLIIRSSAVARATGSIRWQPGRKKGMTYSDAEEAAKSSVLRRCAKDLGIGSEMWDKVWCEAWKQANASLYEVMEMSGDRKGELSYEWHRNDREPRDTKRREFRKIFGGGAPQGESQRQGPGPGQARRSQAAQSQPGAAVPHSEGKGPRIRDPEAPATDKQVALLERKCAQLTPSLVERQLTERGAGCLRELSKGEASSMIDWAQGELAGGVG